MYNAPERAQRQARDLTIVDEDAIESEPAHQGITRR